MVSFAMFAIACSLQIRIFAATAIGTKIFSFDDPLYLPSHSTQPDGQTYYIPDVEVEFDIILHDASRTDIGVYKVFGIGTRHDYMYRYPLLLVNSALNDNNPGQVSLNWRTIDGSNSHNMVWNFGSNPPSYIFPMEQMKHIYFRCNQYYMYFEVDGFELINNTHTFFSVTQNDLIKKYDFYVGGDGERHAANATVSNFAFYSVNPVYTLDPSPSPTSNPSYIPTTDPSISPTITDPSISPTTDPSISPTNYPSISPTSKSPTKYPTISPTDFPTKSPSKYPTFNPTKNPTGSPINIDNTINDKEIDDKMTTYGNEKSSDSVGTKTDNTAIIIAIISVTVVLIVLTFFFLCYYKPWTKLQDHKKYIIGTNLSSETGSNVELNTPSNKKTIIGDATNDKGTRDGQTIIAFSPSSTDIQVLAEINKTTYGNNTSTKMNKLSSASIGTDGGPRYDDNTKEFIIDGDSENEEMSQTTKGFESHNTIDTNTSGGDAIPQKTQQVHEGGEAEGYSYAVNKKGAQEVKSWLNSIEMDQYYEVFIKNGFDLLSAIKEISDKSELNDIGILKGHQLVLMKAIQQLKDEPKNEATEWI